MLVVQCNVDSFFKDGFKIECISFYEVDYNETMYPACFSGVFIIL